MYEMPYHASLICTIYTEVGKINIDTSKSYFFGAPRNCPCCRSNIGLFSIASYIALFIFFMALFIDIDIKVDINN